MAATIIGGCIFELAEVVQPQASGGAASAGEGGAGEGGAGEGGDPGGNTAGYEIEITVNPESALSAPLEDAPVLVVLTSERIDYALTSEGGADIRFFDEEDTPLAHEIEHWEAGSTSLVWVKLPSLEEGQKFYLRFGDAGAPEPPAPQSVWSSYRGVYHMAGALTGNVLDSSSQALHGSATAVEIDEVGAVGQAAKFDGAASRIDFLDGDVEGAFGVPSDGQRSVALWFRRESDGDSKFLFHARDTQCRGYFLDIVDAGDGEVVRHGMAQGSCGSGTSFVDTFLPAVATREPWHKLTVVMDRGGASLATLYLDGVVAVNSPVAIPDGYLNGTDAGIGVASPDMGSGKHMDGSIDEVRVSDRAFTDQWVAIQYESQRDELLMFGPTLAR